MVQGQLMLVKLRQNCTNVQMGVCLSFWFLQARLNSEGSLEEVQGSAHFADSKGVSEGGWYLR